MEMRTLVRANWDRVVAVGLVVVGVIALVLGWLGVSGTGIAAEQNPYIISGGLLGIVLCMLGCTVWMSADLQDEWRRLDSIDERLQELSEGTIASARSDNGSSTRPVGRRQRVTAEQ